MPADDRWQLIVISHTHWDREWYMPFESFRVRLVGMMDQLLDLLDADPEFKHFMLDGQSIVLEDYLAVRPDRRADVERHVRAGRLLVGPWYILPDEFLVGGEALVRNLLIGLRVAAEFGPVMKVGYLPDSFGQIDHMPAVLRGFGIEDAVIFRGADPSLVNTEFFWRAPDGSEVFTLHLAQGYFNANMLPLAPEELEGRLRFVRQELEPRATTRFLPVMNGVDHDPAQAELPRILATANQLMPDAEFIHGTLPMLISKIRKALGEKLGALPRRQGEFRSPQRYHVLQGVGSTRMWIKQRNQECEDLLARWAEPFSTWAALVRARAGEHWKEPALATVPRSPYPADPASLDSLLDRAWRYLLENQPHDSICGCSVDAVHKQMWTRFDSCQQIAAEVALHSLRRLAAQIDGGGERRVVVFNPLAERRSDFAMAVVPQREEGEPVAVVDPANERHPCQAVDPSLVAGGEWLAAYLSGLQGDRLAIGFVAADVPGCGYRSFEVEYGPPVAGGAAVADLTIENEFFTVRADPTDGTLHVEDKRTGRVLAGLNRFVDGGDRGDEYNFGPPEEDELVDRPAAPPAIRVLERGSARQTLEVSLTYRLPARLAFERSRRSQERVDCPIVSRVSLDAGVPRIDIRTEVDNRVEDHRLRVHFQSGVKADVSHAEQHFGVVTRPVAVPEFDDTWAEEPLGTFPQKGFVDVNDGRSGLLLANRGLPEYEVLPGDDGLTLALTLLRCVGFLSRGDFSARRGEAGPPITTPDAQCPGRHVFDYALVPHEGGWEEAYRLAHRFAAPMRARWSREGGDLLPPEAGLLEVEGDGFVLSALKRAEDGSGVVARVYNILSRPAEGRLRLTEPHGAVWVVDMKEERLREAETAEGWVRLSARPNEIFNIKFDTVRGW